MTILYFPLSFQTSNTFIPPDFQLIICSYFTEEIEKDQNFHMLPQSPLTWTCADIVGLPTTSHDHRVDVWAPVPATVQSTYTLDAFYQQLLSLDMFKTVHLSFPSKLVLLTIFPRSVNGNSITPGVLAKNLSHSWLLSFSYTPTQICPQIPSVLWLKYICVSTISYYPWCHQLCPNNYLLLPRCTCFTWSTPPVFSQLTINMISLKPKWASLVKTL